MSINRLLVLVHGAPRSSAELSSVGICGETLMEAAYQRKIYRDPEGFFRPWQPHCRHARHRHGIGGSRFHPHDNELPF